MSGAGSAHTFQVYSVIVPATGLVIELAEPAAHRRLQRVPRARSLRLPIVLD
jgi:hypothetical protein